MQSSGCGGHSRSRPAVREGTRVEPELMARAFGWDAREIDGHDVDALAAAMADVPNGSGKPVALIAHTIKGKGVSFMEDDNNWHYRAPTAEEVQIARRELGLA